MHDDVQEEVAEFLPHVFVIRAVDGVDNFVAFFNQSRAKTCMGLLAIPRTPTGRTEAGYDFLQLGDGV